MCRLMEVITCKRALQLSIGTEWIPKSMEERRQRWKTAENIFASKIQTRQISHHVYVSLQAESPNSMIGFSGKKRMHEEALNMYLISSEVRMQT